MTTTTATARFRLAESALDAAVGAAVPQERFLHAYRAARLAASAVLSTAPVRRRRPDVWSRVVAEVPELAEWAEVFARYSPLAAAVEAGLPRVVSEHLASDFLWAVERFCDVVEQRVTAGMVLAA